MGLFEVKNLEFLDHGPYSFTLEAGKILGLYGPSGIGKSLLLKALGDLIPQTGEILLEGESYLGFSGPEYRRKVGYLAAESQWWYELVGQHFGAEGPSDDLFARVGLTSDCLNWSVNRLSTGEKQRLAILRLMLNKPKVLLLDEPTASLDEENVLRIEKWLFEYCKRKEAVAVWVGHDRRQLNRIAHKKAEMPEKGVLRFDS